MNIYYKFIISILFFLTPIAYSKELNNNEKTGDLAETVRFLNRDDPDLERLLTEKKNRNNPIEVAMTGEHEEIDDILRKKEPDINYSQKYDKYLCKGTDSKKKVSKQVYELSSSLSVLVEGSVNHGGLQPNYIIDRDEILDTEVRTKNQRREKLRKVLEEIKDSKKKPILIIQSIVNLTRQLLPEQSYTAQTYLGLLDDYKKRNLDIPLSKYLKIQAGTCRENALLVQFLLNEVGIPSSFVYAKIQRDENETNPDDNYKRFEERRVIGTNRITEDHAFVVVRMVKDQYKVTNNKHVEVKVDYRLNQKQGSDYIIDPYFDQFNGHLLREAKGGYLVGKKVIWKDFKKHPERHQQEKEKVAERAPYAEKDPSPVSITIKEVYDFPAFWIPKSDSSQP